LKSSNQIRQEFLDFFKEKGHKIVPSASVIPYDDPSLLFTNAGMNQFKDVFLGTGKREYSRCANTQKCIRVSGKHNDIEEVGHDGYHHTFFEMLGNWSFGDYYKKEAIRWAWELFTEVWKFPKHKLWATVYKTDDEAYDYWKSETDIDRSHILRFGEKDNFWEMGETGPCGPCSEIHIDLTKDGCKQEDINEGKVEVELWNLVFIQYNRDANGKLHELPMRHVDTGMGFERVVSILQNKKSDYETDCFLPLINELINLTGKDYTGEKYQSSMNVIADHIRALTFAIGDGAIPSNEGRGYVLRRILRRAARYGRNLDMRKPFIYNLVDVLVNNMGSVFSEIVEKHKFIKEVVEAEEESFNETLDRGLVFFNEEIEKMKKHSERVFSGDVAFKLHDTYGFPIDLTQLMARELGFTIDVQKFDELMNVQRLRARKSKVYIAIPKGENKYKFYDTITRYVPYDIKENGIITRILHIEDSYPLGQPVDLKIPGIKNIGNEHVKDIYLKENPFYTESGGQVTDTGELITRTKKGDELKLNVVFSDINCVIVNNYDTDVDVTKEVIAKVDFSRRLAVQRNHSATHLVHEALRQVLGPHVKQMGSYLDDKLLRFDFPHFHKLSQDDIRNIEDIVNDKISENIGVNWEVMPIEKAEKIPNVKKFFGEKYGDEVRVVFIDEKFSVEFCGGTHVKDTSDIGLFKIVKEESISSGVRRIFARTGEGIIQLIDEKVNDIEKILNNLPEKYSSNFKSGIDDFKINYKSIDFHDAETLKLLISYQDKTYNSLLDLHEKYLEEKKQAEKMLVKQKVQNASASLNEIISKGFRFNEMNIVSAKFDVNNMDELKDIADTLRAKIGSGVGLLYSILDGKVNLVAVVSDNLIKDKGLNAGKIAGDFAKIIGGGGGGKPHLATAGGKDIDKLDFALSELKNIVQKYLK
jgi:alanyl-tRNA synthetase